MNKFKPLFAVGLTLSFVILGFYLINKSQLPGIENAPLHLIVGIACLVFFGGLLILALFKLVRK